MASLNLGILAHVDAGKTSLTERLLYVAGVIGEPGSVDHGTTQTDSLELERRRGITIRSAVVSFELAARDGRAVTVNLIDTPGHPDFIAEVERVLGVLDGAVLVVSAVEGVQAQTRVLLRTLHRLRIPTIVFVNKIDRTGARDAGVLAEMAARLTPALVPMSAVHGLGTREATADTVAPPLDVLAEGDEALLRAYVEDSPADPMPALRAQTLAAAVHPVFFGSAVTGAGVAGLIDGIVTLLPPAFAVPDGDPAGVVFKVERGTAGEKLAYVRMTAGCLRVREKVGADKVTGLRVFTGGGTEERDVVSAGQIALVRGLAGIRVGDPIGAARPDEGGQFAPPSLQTVVRAADPAQRGAVHQALTELAEQDPLIGLRADDTVSLYGEVQKEVIESTLAEQYGLAVTFHGTSTVCAERLIGCGSAVDLLGAGDNPYLAQIGLRVEPGPPGSGVDFGLEVELGSMPYAFFTAVEETVRATLAEGLHGWPVHDVRVRMTRSGYCARASSGHNPFDKSVSSTAGDFRYLTPLVLMAAVRQAGTRVLEPVHALRLEVPADTLPAVLPVLGHLRGIPLGTTVRGETRVVDGEIPAAEVQPLRRRLAALTRGEGVLESVFDRYEPVPGVPPARARTDHNPLDRREYVRRTPR